VRATRGLGDRLLIVQTIVQFYREARRRKVFRTAGLYVLGAWAALQVADVLFPGYGVPDAAIQALVWAAALGFPVALVFGWLFEVGPGGIRRTTPRAAGEHAQPRPLARRDYLLLAAFAAIGVFLALRAVEQVRDAPAEAETAAVETADAEVTRLPNSIAVLPFTNISSDPDNEYFCDGVSEEILNKLSGVRQLNVIGRTSSFAFKGSNTGIERISAVLGVGYVLQGSVRKAGSQLRISAQLLDERGRQLWAQSFDRKLENVFEIQDEIAQSVATTVAEQVIRNPEPVRRPNLDAYDHYLAGRELLHRRDFGAMAELERAIELDPHFAEAYAELAIARLIGNPSSQELEAAAASMHRALELKPQLLRARAAQALWSLASTPPDAAAAEATLRGVLAEDPNMSDALLWLSNSLFEQGRDDEALEILRRANRIDPLHPSIAVNLANELRDRGEDDAALDLIKRLLEQPKPGYGAFMSVRNWYRVLGKLVEMNAVAKDAALRDAPNHYSLALSYALLGDLSRADDWIERSLRDFPEFVFNPIFGSIIPGWRGDLELARQRFEQALKVHGDDAVFRSPFDHLLYGAVLARSGHYNAAIEVLEPLAADAVSPESMQLGPDQPESDGWHALAWSYQHIGEEAKAAEILSALEDECRSRMNAKRHSLHSDLLHYCAETALMAGDSEEALAVLERAINAGWRDYYVRQNDPYWSSLASDPRYQALMAKVKADIARQRAEVERIDATDDFMTRLDAALAARHRPDR
jgi:TolB-like protein/predicted Zn-dependent protease